MNDIYTAFHEFFEIIEADSAELLEVAYRLRYEIYCLENGFLDLKNYPDGLEKDEYDYHSVHILLKHRPSDRFVGTVRLIIQDPLNLDKVLPIEKHTKIDPKFLDVSKLPRQHVAEISRFAILKQFSSRRFKQQDIQNKIITKKNGLVDRRRFPNIALALVVGIVRMSALYKIDHWLTVMNPCLNRLLSYFGSNLYPVGPSVNYYGMRQPYHVKVIDVIDRMYRNHRDIWELMTDYGKSCPYSMKYTRTGISKNDGALLDCNKKMANDLIKVNIISYR